LGFDDEPVLVLLGELACGANDLVDQRSKLHGQCGDTQIRIPKRDVELSSSILANHREYL
jgi:hypothetical protein